METASGLLAADGTGRIESEGLMMTEATTTLEKKPAQDGAQGDGGGPKDLVIGRGCSTFGLERLYVIRPKLAVDAAKWQALLEADAARRGMALTWASQLAYWEEAAGFWHLRLYWKETALVNDIEEGRS
jgi:hypothetical protein